MIEQYNSIAGSLNRGIVIRLKLEKRKRKREKVTCKKYASISIISYASKTTPEIKKRGENSCKVLYPRNSSLKPIISMLQRTPAYSKEHCKIEKKYVKLPPIENVKRKRSSSLHRKFARLSSINSRDVRIINLAGVRLEVTSKESNRCIKLSPKYFHKMNLMLYDFNDYTKSLKSHHVNRSLNADTELNKDANIACNGKQDIIDNIKTLTFQNKEKNEAISIVSTQESINKKALKCNSILREKRVHVATPIPFLRKRTGNFSTFHYINKVAMRGLGREGEEISSKIEEFATLENE